MFQAHRVEGSGGTRVESDQRAYVHYDAVTAREKGMALNRMATRWQHQRLQVEEKTERGTGG